MRPTPSPRPRHNRSEPLEPAAPAERIHERDLVPVCGLAAVLALFARDGGRVERLFFEPRFAPELLTARRALAKARKPYREAETEELARIAGTVRHGGVVAVARPRAVPVFDPKRAAEWVRDRRPVLVLDGVGNPHNLGAIIRSAAFFGVERVLLADRPDQALPSAASYRVAEGGLDRIALYRAPLPAALKALQRHYRVVGASPDQAIPLVELRRDRPVCLVLGNEEKGLEPATLAACDQIVTIPGSGQVQSLNVAAAAAILLYTLTRP